MMNDSDDFSADEKKAILEFREKIQNEETCESEIILDDLILFKFLKGCSFKQNQAEEMLKKHIQWRRTFQVDRILQDYEPLEVLEIYFTQSFMGFDKDGCVIRYGAAGNIDIEGLLQSATIQDILRFIVYLTETDIMKTKQQTIKMGKTVSQLVHIYDLENLTMAKAFNKKALDFLLQLAFLFQENYPERLKSVYVINAPSFFALLFAILKSALSIGFLKKIKVFRHYGWKESLLEIIDENVLPGFMGGKRTDSDGNPLCNTIINHGYPVPEKYYLFNKMVEFKNHEDVRKFTIQKQKREELDIFVENCGSFIECEFQVNPSGIGFGIHFEQNMGNASKIIELIPIHRTEKTDFPQTGKYYCENSGKYTIIFDNTNSLWTAKEVFFKIFVKCKN